MGGCQCAGSKVICRQIVFFLKVFGKNFKIQFSSNLELKKLANFTDFGATKLKNRPIRGRKSLIKFKSFKKTAGRQISTVSSSCFTENIFRVQFWTFDGAMPQTKEHILLAKQISLLEFRIRKQQNFPDDFRNASEENIILLKVSKYSEILRPLQNSENLQI